MGKGNVAKAKVARERKAKQMAKAGNSGGGKEGKAKRMGTGIGQTCAVCRCSFGAKQSKSQLEQHRESKHSKLTFEKCFPEFGKAPAAAAAPAPASGGGGSSRSGKKGRKK